MREVSQEVLDALTGDRSGDRLLVVPWYDGLPTWDGPLEISSWSLDWDRRRQVQCQMSLDVVDEDGRLSPWRMDDTLSVGGARLSCALAFGGLDTEVDIGTYRITGADVSQSMEYQYVIRGFTEDGDGDMASDVPVVWTTSGTVGIEAQDETVGVQLAAFINPESVVHSGSIVAEIERLLDGIIPVVVDDAVVDGSVPSRITYEGGRIDALGSLVRALGAQYRVSSDSQLYIYPSEPGAPVWTIEPGERGVLVDFARAFRAQDLPNVMVVEGRSDSDDRPLIGVARETTGPLRYDGPHGLVPARRQSDILNTQAKVDAAARTYLNAAIQDRALVVPITCLPNPALEVGDVVTLATPLGDLTGPVETMRLSGSASGLHPMQISVTVDYEQAALMGRRMSGNV